MDPRLSFTDDPATFLRETAPVLAADPVLATVLSSWTRKTAAGQVSPPGPGVPRWWVVVRDTGGSAGSVVPAGMRTMPHPPYAPWLMPMDQDAALALARALHEAGSQVCLFTDQANPTSNRIYAAPGFEAYVDTARYRIGPLGPTTPDCRGTP